MPNLIGVLSDTHDNQANLLSVLAFLREKGIITLIHCGDVCTPETAKNLNGFHVIHTIGNGDYLSGEIQRILVEMNLSNYSGLVFEGELEGIPIAVTHGHLPGKLEHLVGMGKYRYIFHGHSHRHKHEFIHDCTVINPGALGGLRPEMRSFCVVNIHNGDVQFIEPH
jgi:uncharacterized protein